MRMPNSLNIVLPRLILRERLALVTRSLPRAARAECDPPLNLQHGEADGGRRPWSDWMLRAV